MAYAADLHIHSSYARATSRELNFENLARWAKIKGIDLLASADFTHPAWFEETRRKLVDSGDGLYEFDGVKLILGTEVSCTGEQGGRSRRIHVLIFAPSLDTVERINAELAKKGNLREDGRPTLALTPKALLETLLDLDERIILIPAHAWTPWFGIYGSKSGFDSLEECFEELTPRITAIETGLSSEPAMNWRVGELDGVSIVSFSDAHSLPRLGRELTVFNGELSYGGFADALKKQDIAYTVEFFPEEGKYHYSGHRKCGVSLSPDEVAKNGTRCPVCKRRLTLGVLQRVEQLASRDAQTTIDERGFTALVSLSNLHSVNGRPPFKMLVSLQQIVAESLGVGVNAKRAQAQYEGLIEKLGTELHILMDAPLLEIERASSARTAEGIARVRKNDIAIEPGYDGQYGKVAVWPDSSPKSTQAQQMAMRLDE